jgi:hypothetical protein
MDFTTALIKFSTPKTITTLGGRSEITVFSEDGVLIIENSGGTTRSINTEYWEEVKKRRRSLGKAKDSTSMYTDPEWNLPYPTDRIFAPYVAAVMRYLEG